MIDNRFMCSGCKAVFLQSQLLHKLSPFDADQTLIACPRCKQCDEDIIEVCDEPSCSQQAGTGWTTGDKSDIWGGYRHTCDQHMARYEFKTARQSGAVAGDGRPCTNDHDPDCRWPQCGCRQ